MTCSLRELTERFSRRRRHHHHHRDNNLGLVNAQTEGQLRLFSSNIHFLLCSRFLDPIFSYSSLGVLLSAMSLVSGCVSLHQLNKAPVPPQIYGGTRNYLKWACDGELLADADVVGGPLVVIPFAAIDIPLTLLMDTLLLPATTIIELFFVPRAINDARKGLCAESSEIRLAALRRLAEIGPRSQNAIECVIPLLSHKDAKTREWAAIVIGRLGPAGKKGVLELIAAVKDPEVGVRREATRALGRIGSPALAAISTLQNVLENDSFEVASLAREAIDRIGRDK